MKAADRTEYIVQALMESGSMYEDGARSFLAEHDAAHRVPVVTTDPLVVRWDRLVMHPAQPDDDETIVCCLTEDGRPVALVLDGELREALGLQLIDPDGDDDAPDGLLYDLPAGFIAGPGGEQ